MFILFYVTTRTVSRNVSQLVVTNGVEQRGRPAPLAAAKTACAHGASGDQVMALLFALLIAALIAFSPPTRAANFELGMEAFERSDYATAFDILDDLALDGDPRALAIAGSMWEQGLGTIMNLAEALRYYKAGAERDNPRCMVGLGRFLKEGIATEADPKTAASWFSRAVARGDNDAAFELAQQYLSGEGVDKDQDKALTLLRDAASNGHAKSQAMLAGLFNGAVEAQAGGLTLDSFVKAAEEGDANIQAQLAYLYESGAGVERNYARAFHWYEQAALQGHADSQASLGYLFQTGLGVERSLPDARLWYEKALVQEHPVAQSNLAYMHLTGEGLPRNDARAVELYTAAAAQGNANAQNNLGTLYQRGQGVEVDHARALAQFRQAAKQEFPQAQTNLGYAYQNGLGVERNLKAAADWYRKAAEKKYPHAQANLAFLYQQGTGVEKDLNKALKLYHEAAEAGSSYAQRNLGRAYQYGIGETKDLQRAAAWYRLAAKSGDAEASRALEQLAK